MDKQSCCPPGSWPAIHEQHPTKGEYLKIGETNVYHVGQGDRVLVLISDIFGIQGGRHKLVADTYSQFGYDVYLPQLLSPPYVPGDKVTIMENILGQNWQLIASKFDGLVKYLKQKGKKSFLSVGFCWGLWTAFKLAVQYQEFICIAGFHPSLGIQSKFGRSQPQLAKSIKCPAFLYPAGNDPPNVKTNGEIVQILEDKFGKDKTGTIQFPDMLHGWVVRGDLKDEKVKRDVLKAIEYSLEYLKKF